MRAILAVDVQNDFCDDGSLPVEGGYEVAREIKELLSQYEFAAASRDWHIDPRSHFEIWPVHCVAGTYGADFAAPLTAVDFDVVVHKGQYAAAYSAFDDTRLEKILNRRGVTELDVTGLALDWCVKQSVLDAIKLGFTVRVLTWACRGVAQDTTFAAVEEMKAAGATFVEKWT